MILDEKPTEEQKPLPPPVRRFISIATDMIQDEYMQFKDHTMPLVERVRAGHRLLSTAAGEFRKAGKEDRAKKIGLFLLAYEAPRIKAQIVKQGDDMLVYRLTIGGATESYSDVALNDLKLGKDIIEDQRHEDYYNKVLARVVGAVMVELAELGIVAEKPPQLAFSFGHLTAPIDINEGEDEPDAGTEA